MLDTDICIYLIKGNQDALNRAYKEKVIAQEKFCISWMSYLEMVYGIRKSASKKTNQDNLNAFLENIPVEPIEDKSEQFIENYASIRITLEKAGEPLDQLDLLIGAHALTLGATLVTNNTKHFQRIPVLSIENWTQ